MFMARMRDLLDLQVSLVGRSFVELVKHRRKNAATDENGEQDQCGYVPTQTQSVT